MITHTFRARSMHEALASIRRELGDDVVIVGRRTLEPSDEASIEVTVGIQDRALPCPLDQLSSERLDRVGDQFRLRVRQSVADTGDSWLEKLVEREQSKTNHDRFQKFCGEMLERLQDRDVDEALARKWIDGLHYESQARVDTAGLRAQLLDAMTRQLQVRRPLKVDRHHQNTIALVGPTGAGKTTTVAKLATHYRLVEDVTVGVITLGMCELGVPDLLRKYCEIIDVPLAGVETSAEMGQALGAMSAQSLVLIDTAGHGHHDQFKHQHIRNVLADVGVNEVHLVLSCVANRHALRDAIIRFSDVEPHALLLTKVDEASRLGHLVGVLRECKLPVTYLTRGQRIPQDLEVADASKLAREVLA